MITNNGVDYPRVWSLGATAEAQVGRSVGLVNPDLASEKELLALPHMNEASLKKFWNAGRFSR